MHRLKRIKEFALSEADRLVDRGNAINPGEIDALKDFSQVVKNMCKAMKYYHEMGRDSVAPVADNDEWGDASPEARRLFENLEHHYIGFWRYAAMHQRTHCAMSKEKMLMHFKSQLKAHDDIAQFVRGNCPAACPEIAAILQEWMAKR